MIYIAKSSENISEKLKLWAVYSYIAHRDDSFNIEWANIDSLPEDFKLELSRTGYGKPYLENSDIHLSLSHTGDLYAIALCSFNVGLDIQLESDTLKDRDIKLLLPRFFVQDEQRIIANSRDTNSAFYSTFTKKEALAKLDGRGLSIFSKLNSQKGNTIDLTDKMSELFGQRVYGAVAF